MIFRDKTHKQEFEALVERMNADRNRNRDVYRVALAYLITADKVCSEHIDNIYDFEERCIIPACLNKGWQTGTSLKTCRLALNLFTGCCEIWCDEENKDLITPAEIFCCSLAPLYWEAIKLCYPQYIKDNQYLE